MGSARETLVRQLLACLPKADLFKIAEPRWIDGEADGAPFRALAMPVQEVPGHARLVVSAIFDRVDDIHSEAAEQTYWRRRPFAVGYFRLWQIDRTRARRVVALEAALDRTEFGVVLLDREARVVFVNEAANLILDSEEGMRHRGGLVANRLHDAVRLRTAIEHVLQADGPAKQGPLLMLSRHNKPALVVLIIPMNRPAEEPSDVAAIVYVLDPAFDTERLLRPICKLYHLSPVEARLACLLALRVTISCFDLD